MFPTTGRVDMFPPTDDINLINSTHVEVIIKMQLVEKAKNRAFNLKKEP